MQIPTANFKKIELERATPQRQLGFGAKLDGFARGDKKFSAAEHFGSVVTSCMNMPTGAFSTIESVTYPYQGPVSTANIQSAFNSTINLLNPGGLAGSDQPVSTYAQIGEFQIPTLITAIQVRVDPFPFNATVPGNSVPTSVTTKGVSPDVYVPAYNGSGNGDVVASGPLGLGTTGAITPAIAEIGWWQDLFAYFLARAYLVKWMFGGSFQLMYQELRSILYVPSNAQSGSAGSSEIDPYVIVNEGNTYYQGAFGATSQFELLNAARVGNETLAAYPGGAAVGSTFHPTRAYERVSATYGGAGVHATVRSNAEWYRLCCPILVCAGVPIGFQLQVADTGFQQLMQSWLDPTFAPKFSGGVSPAVLSESNLFGNGTTAAGTSGATFVEQSSDSGGPANNSVGMTVGRAIYKFGPWAITLAFKGKELSPDQASQFKGDPQTRAMCSANTGLIWSPNHLARL